MVVYSHPLYEGARISQGFGANPNNGNNGPGGHNGDDYAVPHGTPVKAVADGVVEFEGWVTGSYLKNPWWFTPGAGITVIIDHGNGNPDSAYSHLSRTVVNHKQVVKRGQVIGYVGTTGNSSGPHLHFSMFPPNYNLNSPTYGTVNPNIYLAPKLVQRKITANVAWVRTQPKRGTNLAPGYPKGIGKGATISVVGHVRGEDPYRSGDNAWLKTKSGFYVWANAAGNDLRGIPDVN